MKKKRYALHMQLEPEAYTPNSQTAMENPLKSMVVVFGSIFTLVSFVLVGTLPTLQGYLAHKNMPPPRILP